MTSPGRDVPARRGALTFVLHTHLPWVLHHGRWPHGSDWLCEAVAECYLPLLDVLETRARPGRSLGLTLGVSPVLAEQLEHPDFDAECAAYLTQHRLAAMRDARQFDRARRPADAALARHWATGYEDALARWRGGPGLIARLARLEAMGAIELIPCAATHGYLPLLASPAAVHRQVAVAVESHRRRFGKSPRGMWLPECAYRPAGAWTSPVIDGLAEGSREGLETVLAEHGLDFFFVERHLVEAGAPLDVFSAHRRLVPFQAAARGGMPLARERAIEHAGPERPRADRLHRAGTSHVLVFARDAETSQQVWSREGGYPGDPAYREFHRRHDPGGLRYWAVTDPHGDLADKRAYEPEAANERARLHAAHFVDGVAARLQADPAAGLTATYDTELFGHWWHEGPRFLAEVLDRAEARGLPLATAGERASREPGAPRVALREGSWGEGGGHDYWLHDGTRALWRSLHEAELAFEAIARRVGERRDPLVDRLLTQALREVLLLEASDWTFLVTTGDAADYAEARASGHARDAMRLLALADAACDREDRRADARLELTDEAFVAGCERRDDPFPWLDWRAGLSRDADRARVGAITEPAPVAPDPAWLSAIPGPDRPSRHGRGSSGASSRSRAALHPRRGARDS